MALKNKLTSTGSPLSNLNGGTATVPNFKLSKVHDEYSINGSPIVPGKPAPSILDLNGEVPTNNYRNNTPEGRTF